MNRIIKNIPNNITFHSDNKNMKNDLTHSINV